MEGKPGELGKASEEALVPPRRKAVQLKEAQKGKRFAEAAQAGLAAAQELLAWR